MANGRFALTAWAKSNPTLPRPTTAASGGPTWAAQSLGYSHGADSQIDFAVAAGCLLADGAFCPRRAAGPGSAQSDLANRNCRTVWRTAACRADRCSRQNASWRRWFGEKVELLTHSLPIFDDAVVHAVEKFRFEPGRYMGKPVPVEITYTHTFLPPPPPPAPPPQGGPR